MQAVGPSKPDAPHPPAAVLLISDGTQTVQGTSPVVAAKTAKKHGVRVSTVLVGYSDLAQLEDALRWTARGPLPEAGVERVVALAS